jgi:hypothetical protein
MGEYEDGTVVMREVEEGGCLANEWSRVQKLGVS